jgi:hypothetical protein
MLRVLLITILVLTGISGCLDLASGCETEPIQRAVSPNGKLQAVRVIIDCGATTSSSSSIRIVESSDTTAKGYPENTILAPAGVTSFKWLTDDSLVIKGFDTTIADRKEKFDLVKSKGQIIIVYQY